MYSSRDCVIKINPSCRVCSLLFASFMLVSHQPPVLPPVFLSRCQSFETALACASSRKFHSEQKPNISTRLTFDYLLAWDIKGPSVFILLQSDQLWQTQSLSSYPSIFLTTVQNMFLQGVSLKSKESCLHCYQIVSSTLPCDLQRLQTWVTCRHLFYCFYTVFTLRDLDWKNSVAWHRLCRRFIEGLNKKSEL